ncbi:ribbon-helix-helix domain-containing protein [Methylobacterium sp. J-088]|uniref:ribbon-helix-helix domain-containing protein n=1 Tax=Methylobacterium sp. J-088 TaxID=2836664 RepID=UPI001FB954DC|nr:ribbon-helix-helix domain-containing protein [Methylobacterium sp. J-088]MCJ2065868.1 ribbon-helix-helix domain-containing protein [Methylobacterium sp. J-088]
MSDPIVFDDGVRFTEIIRVRVPADLREQVEVTAKAANLSVSEFCRRAIAERLARSTAPGGTPGPENHERTEHV